MALSARGRIVSKSVVVKKKAKQQQMNNNYSSSIATTNKKRIRPDAKSRDAPSMHRREVFVSRMALRGRENGVALMDVTTKS